MNRNSWTVDGVGDTPLSYLSWPVNAVSHTQFYQLSQAESCQFQVAADIFYSSRCRILG